MNCSNDNFHAKCDLIPLDAALSACFCFYSHDYSCTHDCVCTGNDWINLFGSCYCSACTDDDDDDDEDEDEKGKPERK